MIFTKYRPNEFAKIAGGGTPSTSNNNYWNGEIPWITPKDLSGYNFKWISKGERKITEEGLRNSSAKLLPENTVLLSSRAPVGYLAIAKNLISTNQGFKSLICNEEIAHYNFIYYLLVNNRDLLISRAGGSTFGELSARRLSEIEFNIPPLPTQRKIASILSAYDDLIENNLKRIKLLEEKALMEYRILYSENELKEYPIEDVWEIKYGKNLPQTKITESGKYPVYGAAGRIGFYEEFNYEFPVALVTSRGNGSGVAHRTNQAAFVTNNSFAFVPKEEFVDVHFHLAEMILRELELTQLRSGTAQPQLTIAGLIGVKLKLPNKEALIEFNKVVDPAFDFINTLEKQNTKLREARDILLPRLMSGEVEV